MAFIEKDDLIKYIQEDNLDQILDGDETRLDEPINDAIAYAKGFLDNRYNTNSIFGESGSSRHSVVRVAVTHIAIYYLHNLINPRFMPDIRVKNYDIAINTLKMIRKGEICQDLPLLTTDETETGYVKYGNKQNKNNY